MDKQVKLWIFNIVMLVFFIFVVFIPLNDGKTLFTTGMDKLLGVADKNKEAQ